MGKIASLTGEKFGRLTVISLENQRYRNQAVWLCQCSCNDDKFVRMTTGKLKSGTKSCGCLIKEKARKMCIERNTTHGLRFHPLYGVWCGMKSRCYNKNSQDYPNYGGRGIVVCDEWLNDFSKFVRDMGDRPPGNSLDRIDVNLGYCPENCKWSNNETQGNNKTDNVFIEYNGKTRSLSQWAREYNLTVRLLWQRLNLLNWNIEKALTTPVRKIRKDHEQRNCGVSNTLDHGHAARNQTSPTYNSYNAMLSRCRNPNNNDYKNYGGRGITVCDSWQGKNGFKTFLLDMGERPIDHTLDRVDVNLGYCLENCRWADKFVQAKNKRKLK